MFSTFTTRGGKTLIIRSEDLRTLLDADDGCSIGWEVAGELRTMNVQGTASENLTRLQQEEIANVLKVQAQQQRAQAGYPVPPVPRGKVV